MIQVGYAIVWWLLLVVVGLVTFPLVSRVCNRLPDRGYSISKILGLLLITYFSGLVASAHLLKWGGGPPSANLRQWISVGRICMVQRNPTLVLSIHGSVIFIPGGDDSNHHDRLLLPVSFRLQYLVNSL